MNIVIVGGGTAGWLSALFVVKRYPGIHKVTIVESSKIGVVGVGESTTGLFTNIINNHLWDFGCDHTELILETGATLKYGIKHKGWTNDIEDAYIGPIDGSYSRESAPDALFAWGMKNLPKKELIRVSRLGHLVHNNLSNFDASTNTFVNHNHALHVDAYLIGKYFKKIVMRTADAVEIDSEVTNVNLKENGFIKNINLANGQTIEGDFFIDCTGFSKVLMNKLPNKWVSFQENLPLNTAMPFHLKYLEGETPESFTTAWAQKNGWMWQIPLMDRKGCGYVFDDRFTTPDKAQEEIETILGRKIEPYKVIKFDSGRQESAWVNNCLVIGLSSTFLEPLEATAIHSMIVQIKNFVFEYLRPTLDDTVNCGSINTYNKRTAKMFDDFKEFVLMHYMGGRTDSEFWKYVSSGATQTDLTKDILEMSKHRLSTWNDYPHYWGAAGWPLWSFVLEGIGAINKDAAYNELYTEIPGQDGRLDYLTAQAYYDLQDSWDSERKDWLPYDQFINYFRKIRADNGL